MRKRTGVLFLCAVAGATWQLGGCGGALTVPITIPLGNSKTFDVTSGDPASKTFTSTGTNDSGITIGSGSIMIDPSVLTVTPDQSKTLQTTLPIPDTCGVACALANQSEATCTAVCNSGDVVIRVWVGLQNEADPMATGDEYGPFVVTLDGEANPISIDPEQVGLQSKTLQAINEGVAKLTVQIISPYTGTVTLDSITVNAGL
ncbi:MAG: hypothetical protein H6817_06270 [Phycisphaerales bacterium]|nr:hypothetical protein [Phycisphaerales bacterium]